MKRFYTPFLYIVTTILGMVYGSTWLGAYNTGNWLDVVQIINFGGDKPAVFRVLVPYLARTLTRVFLIPPDYSIFILVVIFYVGMFWALQYFGNTFCSNNKRIAFFAFVGVLGASLLLSTGFGELCDPATVFFFALSLGFLARNKMLHYHLLFPLATLNRETTFLLTLFFAVYYYRRILMPSYVLSGAYQAFVYISIKVLLSYLFANNEGKAMFFLDYKVLQVYMANLLLTGGVIVILLVCLYFVFKNWREKPLFLRVAFLCIFFTQILLHFLFGYAYELRVFLESVPVIAMLCMFSGVKGKFDTQFEGQLTP